MTRTMPGLLTALVALAVLAPATAVHANGGYDVRPDVAEVGVPTPDVRFEGAGWGHGVGMSQWGAFAMSQAGRSRSDILHHYYQGTSLHTEDDTDVVTVNLFGGRDGASRTRTTVVSGDRDIAWRLCDGDGCQNRTQPASTNWLVDVLDSGETGVRVRDHENAVHAGNQEVQVRLTSQSHNPDPDTRAGRSVRAASPNGPDRDYGYGHLIFTPDAGGDELAMVNLLSMGAYVRGIAEVPSGWGADGGGAALEAQAIVARTYAYANGRRVCATPTCQVFNGLAKEQESTGHHWVAAVHSPSGRVMRAPEGGFAQTFYSSSHGGRSENIEDSWAYGTTAISHLRSVDDPWSLRPAGNIYRSWTATVANRDVARLLSEGSGLDGMRTVERLAARSHTDGGTPREVEVRGRRSDGSEVSGVFTRPGSGKEIAGAHFRTKLRDVSVAPASGSSHLTTLPSSQIDRIGFGPFRDDDGSVHEFAIAWAAEAGITQGFDDGTFRPGTPVTRSQMASFIYRTFNVPPSSSDHFSDVDPSSTHGGAINALADAGIARGHEDGTFRPGSSVTRAQMASFLVRAIGLSGVEPDGRFEDVSGGTHAEAIHAIADAGITVGCREDHYCPNDSVRRGQMATFLFRTVEEQ